MAALAVLASLPRVPLGPALLMIATAYLSLQSHRFRVEFSLVTVVMAAAMLRQSALAARAARGAVGGIAGFALALALAVIEHERIGRRPEVDLLPERALAFAVENDVARRPFHTIGFGSYLLWELYGQRPTFIDGRNFDPGVYGDFLRAQTNAPALRAVVEKYAVDSFILPAPARADAGMRNVHESVRSWGAAWDLVHMDEEAFVYVARASADSTWLVAHAYRAYHPLAFAGVRLSAEQFDHALVELERLTAESPGYGQAWMDLGLARLSRGEASAAVTAFERAVEINRDDAVAWNQLGQAAGAAGDFTRAIAAFMELTRLVPGNPSAHAHLARAYAAAGDNAKAIAACERALALDPNHPRGPRPHADTAPRALTSTTERILLVTVRRAGCRAPHDHRSARECAARVRHDG